LKVGKFRKELVWSTRNISRADLRRLNRRRCTS
jgi:hypothetical protein